MRVVSNETARASRTATVLLSLFRRERAAFGKRKPRAPAGAAGEAREDRAPVSSRAPPAAPAVVETRFRSLRVLMGTSRCIIIGRNVKVCRSEG